MLLEYFAYRAKVLNEVVEPNLLDADGARQMFEALQKKFKPPSSIIPMNKQKGEKKAPAFLTASINTLIHYYSQGSNCDFDPRSLTTITANGPPVGSRHVVVKASVGELIKRRILAWFARRANPGWGSCLRCGMPFNCTTIHTVPDIGGGGGFFPCCEWCWKRMEIYQRLESTKKLFLLWTKGNKNIPPEGSESLAAMTEAVIQEWINESE